MRSTPKPILIATIMFLCVCCVQFAEAQRRTEGKLELRPLGSLENRIETIVSRDPSKCCPRKTCCLYWAFINATTKCKSSGDVGILINFPRNSTAVVEEVSLEIYSAKDELVFSIKTQNLSLRATDNPTGFLLALDKTAASKAQPHFIEENKIAVAFKARGDKGVPDKAYLVNINEGKPVK